MKHLTLTLALLSMLGPFSVDTYFPSFPAIADHYGVTLADMQKTLSYYLFALAIMSLFHGALSDSFGRRKVVIITVFIYTLACIGALFAPNFQTLVIFRFIQGLTAGASFIVTQAIARDLYKGHEAQKLMAKIMMLFSIAPAIAPIIGGYLHAWFGWHGVFAFLVLISAGMWLLAFTNLPETLPKEERQRFHPLNLTANYVKVLGNGQFCLLALSSSLCFGGLCVYVTAAPDFILNILHLKETQFAWMFVPIVAGLMAGSFLSHRFAGKVSSEKIIFGAYAMMGTAALCNLFYNLFFIASVPWAVLPLGFYMVGSAMAMPVLTLKALDHFPLNKGLASSIMSFATLVVFTVTSAFVAPLVLGSGFKLASVTFGLFLLNCAFLFWAYKAKEEISIIPENKN